MFANKITRDVSLVAALVVGIAVGIVATSISRSPDTSSASLSSIGANVKSNNDSVRPHGDGFLSMTERFERRLKRQKAHDRLINYLQRHGAENPRTETVPDWQWVTDENAPRDDNTCGIEEGGTVTEISTFRNKILVSYQPPPDTDTSGTPCDGGEEFILPLH